MATKTTAATTAPKKEVKATTTPPRKFVEKEYRLADDRSGLSFIIKIGREKNLLVFDEEKGISRPIRHCPNEPTIYADKQSDFALVEPIIFMHGYLKVGRQEQITQQFLDAHPDNSANGGSWFEEVNDEKEAEADLIIDDLKIDLYNAVRNKLEEDDGIYELEAVVAVLENNVQDASSMSPKSLKRRIYQEIENNPLYFADDSFQVTIFQDDYINRKYFVLRAVKEAIIKKSPNGKSMLWVRDNKTIVTAPRGLELVEYFADFLGTEEGMLVGEEIKRRS
tara:strand:- start:11909 stop:12748 length:840 start_codon:yes stop_codon:yes gene_type:complete